MKIKRLHIIIALLLTPSVYADPVSQNEYRGQVIEYSLTLKKSSASIGKSVDELKKSLTLRLPTLSLSGNFNYNLRRADGVDPWYFDLQPQLTQTLYGGGGVRSEIESYKIKSDIALCDAEFQYFEVLYAADYAYWNLIATERYRNVMIEYIEIIKSLNSVISRRFNEGYTSKGDLLMMSSRLSEAEYDLVSAEQSYTMALHNFNTLRGTSVDESVELIRVDTKSVVAMRRVELAEVLLRRADYISSQLSCNLYEVAIASTKASYNPSLKVGIGATWLPYTNLYPTNSRVDGVVFAQLSAQIFHFNERRNAVSAARATLTESQLTEQSLHDTILLEESNGWTTILDTQAQLYAASKSLKIAGESLDISTYSYNEGQATVLDVMQAQLSWIQVYTNSINAEFNYMIALSSYRKITATEGW